MSPALDNAVVEALRAGRSAESIIRDALAAGIPPSKVRKAIRRVCSQVAAQIVVPRTLPRRRSGRRPTPPRKVVHRETAALQAPPAKVDEPPAPTAEVVHPALPPGHGHRRTKTMSAKAIAREPVDPALAPFLEEAERWRPRCRAECAQAERPCPFVGCRHHLYLDVNPGTGSIKLNFPDQELEEIPESCALDVADRGGVTLEEVGRFMNVTRERVRQLETRCLVRAKRAAGPQEDCAA